jgi:hypothetical protein
VNSKKSTEDAPVSPDEWAIDELLLCDPGRIARLLDAPSPAKLITSTADAAMRAAVPGGTLLAFVQCLDNPEYVRLEARIPIPSDLFDSLFNGRTGYRAHYYASPVEGAAFNRKIVDTLIPAVLEACRSLIFKKNVQAIEQSLSGSYSKIWVVGDAEAFLDSPAALKPPRWRAYWQGREKAFGLRLPCPPPPQIDLKGTFVKPGSDEQWVYEGKKDRDEQIFQKGWT